MSKIISIGTAVPAWTHKQDAILDFMQAAYRLDAVEARKLRFLYRASGIQQRHSVLPDYGAPERDWTFYTNTEAGLESASLERRMEVYDREALPLTATAMRIAVTESDLLSVTHLITVSCTGMSAPGLDLQVVEALGLPPTVFRTSVNFMGCYAAIHALRMADAFCKSEPGAQVMVVCTELCTLHFQTDTSPDAIAASLLFGDGSAAALVVGDAHPAEGLHLDGFYAEVLPAGKGNMSWRLSSNGFLMTLSGYIPELIGADFRAIAERSANGQGYALSDITHWCIHPGGKRVLEAVQKSLSLPAGALQHSYDVLAQNGNLSSATLLFVLKAMLESEASIPKLLAAAFGPGLTVETFTASRT